MKIFVVLLLTFATCSAFAAVDEKALAANKKLVRDFYDLAFNKHQYMEAAIKYLTEGYKQHNPYVPDGRKGFIDAFDGAPKDSKSSVEFKRFIAEGDLVVVHSLNRRDSGDRGTAVMDIFRVKGDRIVEHWDVGQKIPENPKNTNTMF